MAAAALGPYAAYINDLPQDPFFPQVTPAGPTFLDSQACLCALTLPPADGSDAAWHCLGNQTTGVYTTNDGLWFKSINGGKNIQLPISDASNPPDTSQPYTINGNGELGTADVSGLSAYDQACTAKNNTVFSTALYRTVIEIATRQVAVDAAPCYRPGAVPMVIQELPDWQQNGCNEGFYCPNNTVNSLPQFCPPVTYCQEARLAGSVCRFQGNNIGMGPFEPVVCQQGYYCPKGGNERIVCPAGSYCQPGAATPTPCTFGSSCPAGSFFETFWIPLIILAIIDLSMIAGVIIVAFRNRGRRPNTSSMKSPRNSSFLSVNPLRRQMAGYSNIKEDPDSEMVTLDATYTPGADVWDGFQSALDLAQIQGTSVEKVEKQLSPSLRLFVESMRRATDAAHFGLSFSYADLTFQPKKAPKPILNKVSGKIERGSLIAVMGGSGAGKSTFVNVLMGKTKHTSGSVMVNNIPDRIDKYKKLIGYVPQDDIILPELTVYENILHSARIRLPRTWSDAEIQRHVMCVIDCLDLSHVRHSLVGTVGKPIISGGQRKRVSVGMELAAAPMAIFLDEPTSGLDATSAASLMQTLKALARLGISVIAIIHQPRMEIFDMIDDLILLANGQMIYQGPEDDVKRYFEGAGFQFPQHSNPGDVITDIITGNGRMYKQAGDISKDALIAHYQSYSSSRNNLVTSSLSRHDSKHDSTLTLSTDPRTMNKILAARGASFFRQVWLCFKRSALQQYRMKSTYWFEIGLATLAGFLLGLAQNSKKGVMFVGLFYEPYAVLSTATDFVSVPELALLTAIAIGLVSASPGVKVFSEELLLHRREAEAGHHRFAYFAAKNLAVAPRMLMGCLHFTVPCLLLATPIIKWWVSFAANLCYFYCIYGLASCVSMITRREDAPLFATMISLIVGILCGAAPPLSTVQSWNMEWLWRASPGVWLAEIYFGQMVYPFAYLYQVDLAAAATGYHLDWLVRNLGILLGIGTLYRAIAFFGLISGGKVRL